MKCEHKHTRRDTLPEGVRYYCIECKSRVENFESKTKLRGHEITSMYIDEATNG